MNRRTFVFAAAAAILHAAPSAFAAEEKEKEKEKDTRCYELRVYYAAEGKLDALHARFRDHTCALFTKHGMTNIGYWTPLENPDRKLIYVLSFPSREARDASWKKFLGDPAWKKAAAESEKGGRLVAKIESTILRATDYTPAITAEQKSPPRVFELRTYTASPGNLSHLHARFRDHTIKLFSKHGIGHLGYWSPDAGQPGADNTLVYILSHESKDACEASFKAFRDDPDWKAAREASEKAGGGSLTAKDGVKSVLMTPTEYSPAR